MMRLALLLALRSPSWQPRWRSPQSGARILGGWRSIRWHPGSDSMNRPLETLSWLDDGNGLSIPAPATEEPALWEARTAGYPWGAHLNLAMRMPSRRGFRAAMNH